MMLLAVRSSLLMSSSQEVSRKPSAAKGLGLPSAGGTTLSSSDSGCSSLALAGALLAEEDEAEGAAEEEVPCAGLGALLPFACFVPAHLQCDLHLCIPHFLHPFVSTVLGRPSLSLHFKCGFHQGPRQSFPMAQASSKVLGPSC